MTIDLPKTYRDYIACLNAQHWSNLARFVQSDIHYNGRMLGLSGYRQMLEGNFEAIPDLQFNITLLICDGPFVASRLSFDCTPKAELFGFPVNGRRVSFSENVFYEFRASRISRVWSVIDKTAVGDQLRSKAGD